MKNPFRRKASPVIVPYVGPKRPEVVRAIARHRPLWIDVSSDEEAYWRLLRSAWTQGTTFVVVEHDNVPHEGALAELIECPEHWCSFPYMVNGSVQVALGCTKFSGFITTVFPDLLDTIGTYSKHWAGLDTYLYLALQARGYLVHEHLPAIEHLHPRANVHTPTAALTVHVEVPDA